MLSWLPWVSLSWHWEELGAAELHGWVLSKPWGAAGDKGLGGRFGFSSISCTSKTLDQGTGPCQGEEIWGSLSCTHWSQGSAGSQGSATEGSFHTEMPTAIKCHQEQTARTGAVGMMDSSAAGAGFSSHCRDGQSGQVWAALCCFPWSLAAACPAGWACGYGQQEVSPENPSISLGCDPRKLAESVPFPLEMLLSSHSISGDLGITTLLENTGCSQAGSFNPAQS